MGNHETSGQEEPLIFDIHWRDKDFLYRGLGGRVSEHKGLEDLGGHAYWVQVEERKFYIPNHLPTKAVVAAVEAYLEESEESFYSYG